MRTNRFIKKSAVAIIIISMLSFAFASRANGLFHSHKQNSTEQFHKTLEEKGYMHISQFSVTKSDVRDSKYFVNFINDGHVYDAYFTKNGELIEVYEVAKI